VLTKSKENRSFFHRETSRQTCAAAEKSSGRIRAGGLGHVLLSLSLQKKHFAFRPSLSTLFRPDAYFVLAHRTLPFSSTKSVHSGNHRVFGNNRGSLVGFEMIEMISLSGAFGSSAIPSIAAR
jgi:hypothetical protein